MKYLFDLQVVKFLLTTENEQLKYSEHLHSTLKSRFFFLPDFITNYEKAIVSEHAPYSIFLAEITYYVLFNNLKWLIAYSKF